MPHLNISTSTGAVNLYYTISTPGDPSAKYIDENLPTVIFLHPVFIGQEIFHKQFRDPRLRRFNCVSVDSRCHGQTTGRVGKDYDRVEAARDIAKFMDALGLPPCHFFGVSMGTSTALQLAISHPEKVLSMFLVSPLPEIEPREAADGRQEIYDAWMRGFSDPSNVDTGELEFALSGMFDFGFNNSSSDFLAKLKARCLSQGMINWTKAKSEDFRAAAVKFFTERQPYLRSDLERISCPVMLVHCTSDVVYGNAAGLKYLREGIKDVKLVVLEGACHYGNVTHKEKINQLMLDFVRAHTSKVLPPAPARVCSPWKKVLNDTVCTLPDDGFVVLVSSEW